MRVKQPSLRHRLYEESRRRPSEQPAIFAGVIVPAQVSAAHNTSNQRRFLIPAALQLSFQDKLTIQSGKWLDGVGINAAHDMMHEQFPPINGMQHCTLSPHFIDDKHQSEIPKKSFQYTAAPSVQIHYIGHSHCVTSFQRAGDTRVFVLDSLYSVYPELPASLQIQLAQIYGSSDGQLVIHIPSLSTKVMGSDCDM